MALSRRRDVRFYDTIVCGAGPAGSRAAYNLAREGFRVLLIEKDRLPRYKSCGGGLTMRAVRALGLAEGDGDEFAGSADGIVERWTYGTHCCLNAARWAEVRGGDPVVAMVMRDRLDAMLTRHAADAGAEVIEGVRVFSASEDHGRAEVRTSDGRFAASYVIGADGAHSIVARSIGSGDAVKLHPAFAAELVPPNGSIHEKYSDMALYDLGCVRGGYGWAFPKREQYSVGISSMRVNAGELRRLFGFFIEKHPFLKECTTRRFKGWFVPLPRNRDAAATLRSVLVGDAAGCVDPFSGEGIPHAIRSGDLAAEFLAQRLREGAGPGLAPYRTILHRGVLKDLRVASILGAFFYAFPRLCFRAVIEDRRAVRHFAALMAGEKGYADILKTLLRSWYRIKWLKR